MNNQLKEYQNFIDDLVKRRPCILVQWVRKGYPHLAENKKFNEFLSKLSRDQKEILALMLQQAKDEGICDVLSYLDEEINLRGLRISRNGIEMAIEPYGTELDFDLVARVEGDNWPNHQLDEKYKTAEE